MVRKRSEVTPSLPDGFDYQPDFLAPAQQSDLLRIFPDLDFRPFDFHGYIAKRRIVEYGWEYDFGTRQASSAPDIPEFLLPIRDRAAAFAGLPSEAFVEAVITEYPPGAPIGWHRDVPQFEVIVGISLGASCRMRLKPHNAEGSIVSIVLEPRSIYRLSGVARWRYQHSIPAVEALRYSITFRTLRVRSKEKSAA